MKQVIFILAMLTLGKVSAASNILEVTSCKEAEVSLNHIYSMKLYANESVKVFEVVMGEPAAVPAGVAIAISRGDSLSNEEAYCRYVPFLTSVDLKRAKSEYNKANGVLTLVMPVRQQDAEGNAISKTLIIKINKSAASERDLVRAELI